MKFNVDVSARGALGLAGVGGVMQEHPMSYQARPKKSPKMSYQAGLKESLKPHVILKDYYFICLFYHIKYDMI